MTTEETWIKLNEALNLLEQYEVWEALLIEDNAMWWPYVDKDKISGQTYDMMMQLQAQRNELLRNRKTTIKNEN